MFRTEPPQQDVLLVWMAQDYLHSIGLVENGLWWRNLPYPLGFAATSGGACYLPDPGAQRYESAFHISTNPAAFRAFSILA